MPSVPRRRTSWQVLWPCASVQRCAACRGSICVCMPRAGAGAGVSFGFARLTHRTGAQAFAIERIVRKRPLRLEKAPLLTRSSDRLGPVAHGADVKMCKLSCVPHPRPLARTLLTTQLRPGRLDTCGVETQRDVGRRQTASRARRSFGRRSPMHDSSVAARSWAVGVGSASNGVQPRRCRCNTANLQVVLN